MDLVDQHVDPSYKGHETLSPNLSRDQLKTNTQMYRTAFPDLNVKIDEVAAAGEKVLLRWTARGTHKGPFMGASPSGKPMKTQGITVYTFRNGKIVEEWTQWDAYGMIRELGILSQVQPPRAQASP
jgi:steroid delta-isomerase-like uncharacterized protein